MELKDLMYEMQLIWLTVTIVSVGVIISIGFLPDTIETGKWFLLFGFVMCWIWMGFTLRAYEIELMNQHNVDNNSNKIK